MKKVTNKLRVVHFPQVGTKVGFFEVDVVDELEAKKIMDVLANQHLWLFKNKVIPDYANIIAVEMWDESIDEETNQPYGWSNYFNEEEGMEFDEFIDSYLIDKWLDKEIETIKEKY